MWTQLTPISLRRLYECLRNIDPALQAASTGFEQLLEQEDVLEGLEVSDAQEKDVDSELARMEARLLQMQRSQVSSLVPHISLCAIHADMQDVNPLDVNQKTSTNVVPSQTLSAIPGWRKVNEGEWRPCPIGIWGCV
jgi:hypothetical protein